MQYLILTLEIMNNTYAEFYASQIVESIFKYIVDAPSVSNSVAHFSPLRDFINQLPNNLPTVDPHIRAILDGYIWKSCNIPNSINNTTIAQNICPNIPIYNKYYINYFIAKLVEINFSTNLPYEVLIVLKQLNLDIDKVEFIGNLDISKLKTISVEWGKFDLKMKLHEFLNNNRLHIPDNIDKGHYYKQIQINGTFLIEEFKVRVGYLSNPDSIETKQYLLNLIVNYRYKLVAMLETVPNVNKSNILTMLKDNFVYNINDFSSYNWKDLSKTFFWSIQDQTCYQGGFKCKVTEFSAVYDAFQEAKNNELVSLSQDPTQNINSSQKIGSNIYNRVIPKTYLVGLMYDDTLNSANLRYINKCSEIV